MWTILIVLCTRKVSIGVQTLMIIPLILFSSFRGTAGPDTETYIRLFYNIEKIVASGFSFIYEPITTALMYFSITLFSEHHEYFFALHSAILSGLFIYFCKNFEKYRVFLLTIGIAFLIDGLTNTLRVSLAYFFILLSFTRKQNLNYVLAFFSHVSALIAIVFIKAIDYLSNAKKINGIKIILIIIASLILIQSFNFIISFFPVVSEKLLIYQDLEVRSKLSGVSDIFVVFSLLAIGSYFNRSTMNEFLFDLSIAILISVFLYILVGFSLAFLRIIKLLLFSLVISPFLVSPKRKIPSWCLICIGFVYTANFCRTVFTSNGFLPYGN